MSDFRGSRGTRWAHPGRYGATNPAEFFAVATETFFEKPRQLRSKQPQLYSQLQQFFCQDPAALDTR
jgi:hypothetical protein